MKIKFFKTSVMKMMDVPRYEHLDNHEFPEIVIHL